MTAVEDLRAARLMRDEEEFDRFEGALDELGLSPRDPGQLADLYACFDDATEMREVMARLLHFIEKYPLEDNLRALINTIPALLEHASGWLALCWKRMLNSEEARLLLRHEIFPLLPASQVALLRQYLFSLAAQEPAFQEKVSSLFST
jgi:hypothetical protein